jgi:hypothetical protein
MDLVERIVAEVMSQLENEPAVSSGANANDSKVIAGRVITADSLAEQAKGQTKIQVQSEALLTPSANDWIRQNKVELVRGDVAQPTADQAPVTSTASVKSTSNNQTLIVVHDGSSVVDAVNDRSYGNNECRNRRIVGDRQNHRRRESSGRDHRENTLGSLSRQSKRANPSGHR